MADSPTRRAIARRADDRLVFAGFKGALGHREVGAVPPASPAVGEERGVRGFVVMIGT